MDQQIITVIARSISLLATNIDRNPLTQAVRVDFSSDLSNSVLPAQIETELIRLASSVNKVKKLTAIDRFTSTLPISPDECYDPLDAISHSEDGVDRIVQGDPVDHLSHASATLITPHNCISAGAQRGAPSDEHDDLQTLHKELRKYKEANEAFQETLREIGEIITAVAGGDLTRKVRMDSVELDSEITTFKRTINAMMDRLQNFASEVSRVAREVGTEGLLGGQARIDGVDGTWKELTDNGTIYFFTKPNTANLIQTCHSECNGTESHGSR